MKLETTPPRFEMLRSEIEEKSVIFTVCWRYIQHNVAFKAPLVQTDLFVFEKDVYRAHLLEIILSSATAYPNTNCNTRSHPKQRGRIVIKKRFHIFSFLTFFASQINSSNTMMLTTSQTAEYDISKLCDMAMPPKRTLSAYNYFFRSERARLLGIEIDVADVHSPKKRRHRKTHGKISFRNMANQVGARWKALSEEDRAPFVAMFEADRTRYKAEMKAWNSLQRQKKKEIEQRQKDQETAKDEGQDVFSQQQIFQTQKSLKPKTSDDIIERALDIMNTGDIPIDAAPSLIPDRNSRKRMYGELENVYDTALKMMAPEEDNSNSFSALLRGYGDFDEEEDSFQPLPWSQQVPTYNPKMMELNKLHSCFMSLEKELEELMDENESRPQPPAMPERPPTSPVTPLVEDFSDFDFNKDFDFLFGDDPTSQHQISFHQISLPAL